MMAENLENHFCSEKWDAEHKDKKIDKMVVFHLDVSEVPRPDVEPKFSTLQGSASNFAYLPLRPGVLGSRHAGGWCDACMRAHAPGNGLTARLEVLGCTCSDSQAATDGVSRRSRWTEHMVERTDAAGVANRRILAQKQGHRLARKLKVGSIIAVQARERWMVEDAQYRAGHFWLARVVAAGTNHFLGPGVVRQITSRRDSIQTTLFTEGAQHRLLACCTFICHSCLA